MTIRDACFLLVGILASEVLRGIEVSLLALITILLILVLFGIAVVVLSFMWSLIRSVEWRE